jgi:hypothetical protein
VAPGLKRPLHHFYDPYFDRPLDVPGLAYLDPDVHKNPDWAIGSRNSFNDPNTAESSRRNTFTVFDAREAMFRALTLLTPFNGNYTSVASGNIALDEQGRQAYWATTFRSLGDVLHLNQDMAQPQHTRNEPHSGKYCFTLSCPAGHTSVYEKYINARVLKANGFNSLAPYYAPARIGVQPLSIAPYPIPALATYTSYWATAPHYSALTGKGLAEFSNANFFTAGKNLDSTEYSSPSRSLNDYVVTDQSPISWDGSPAKDATALKVFRGNVTDVFEQRLYSGIPLTTFGVWDQFLKERSKKPKYSLNRLNYDAMADLLLPRAVAYSAGLINFFFRGQILVSLPKEGVYAIADHGSTDGGFKILRVKVKNTTGAFVDPQGEDQPQHMRGGTFFAVIRYHKDKKYVDSLDKTVGTDPCDDYFEIVNPDNLSASTECRDGVEQIVVSDPLSGESLDVNTERTLKFSFSKSPIPYGITDVMLQIVYRGPLGSETDAVAVGSLDISEPTYFTYQNDTDYIHLGGHVYTRAEVNANPSLLALVRPQTCVDYRLTPPRLIDWCLKTFDIDIDLSFENVSSPIAHASTLPARRFLRLVYLTDVNEPFNPPIKASARAARSVPRDKDGDEKAYLYHQSICVPHDPFFVRARESQLKVIAPGQLQYATSSFKRLRAVNGWQNEACVVNGDDAAPGTPDDRVTVMTSLTPDSDEMRPYVVTIADEYRPPPQP